MMRLPELTLTTLTVEGRSWDKSARWGPPFRSQGPPKESGWKKKRQQRAKRTTQEIELGIHPLEIKHKTKHTRTNQKAESRKHKAQHTKHQTPNAKRPRRSSESAHGTHQPRTTEAPLSCAEQLKGRTTHHFARAERIPIDNVPIARCLRGS